MSCGILPSGPCERILMVIAFLIAIDSGWARCLKEDEKYPYTCDYRDVGILMKPDIALPVYHCNVNEVITERIKAIHNQKIEIPKRSYCFDAIKYGKLLYKGHTCYNITRNATSSCQFIDKEKNVAINVSITVQEFTAKYDSIRGIVTFPSGSKCNYNNFVCYDHVQNITVYWDKYEANSGDDLLLLYYELTKQYSSETNPDRKTVVIEDVTGTGNLILHLENTTQYGKIIVTETDKENLWISFESEDTLFNLTKPPLGKTDPRKELPFEDKNVYEELERHLGRKGIPEESQNEGNEGTLVTEKEIEKAEYLLTTPKRIEENVDGTVSDQQTTPNTVEQSIAHNEPKEPRDNSRDAEENSIYIPVIACLTVVVVGVVVGVVALFLKYKKRFGHNYYSVNSVA